MSADVYFYFCDTSTGLITGVQPVRYRPDSRVVIEDRTPTGRLDQLPAETRVKLGASPAPDSKEETPR